MLRKFLWKTLLVELPIGCITASFGWITTTNAATKTGQETYRHTYRQRYTHTHTVKPIGVNATGDAGSTSPAIFGQPGTKYLISPAKFVKFLLSHAKRHGAVNLLTSLSRYEHGAVLRLTQTRTRKL